MYYVYEWWRMDLNLPYYIGKGKGKRAYGLKRNKHTDDVTNYLLKNGIRRDIRIIAKFETEEAAMDYEIERIAFWWHLKEHKILTNKTIGGEGVSGYKWTESQKQNHYMKKPENQTRQSLRTKGRVMWQDKPHPFAGKSHKDESKTKMSNKKKGKPAHNSKLNENSIKDILYSNDSLYDLAKKYNCTYQTIWNVKNRRYYKNKIDNVLIKHELDVSNANG